MTTCTPDPYNIKNTVRQLFPLAQLQVDKDGLYFVMSEDTRLSGSHWEPTQAWVKAYEYVSNL